MKILKKESRKQNRKRKRRSRKKRKNECKTVTHPNGCPLRPATREVISRFLVHTWLTPSGLHVISRYNYCSLLGVRAPFALETCKRAFAFFFLQLQKISFKIDFELVKTPPIEVLFFWNDIKVFQEWFFGPTWQSGSQSAWYKCYTMCWLSNTRC